MDTSSQRGDAKRTIGLCDDLSDREIREKKARNKQWAPEADARGTASGKDLGANALACVRITLVHLTRRSRTGATRFADHAASLLRRRLERTMGAGSSGVAAFRNPAVRQKDEIEDECADAVNDELFYIGRHSASSTTAASTIFFLSTTFTLFVICH